MSRISELRKAGMAMMRCMLRRRPHEGGILRGGNLNGHFCICVVHVRRRLLEADKVRRRYETCIGPAWLMIALGDGLLCEVGRHGVHIRCESTESVHANVGVHTAL